MQANASCLLPPRASTTASRNRNRKPGSLRSESAGWGRGRSPRAPVLLGDTSRPLWKRTTIHCFLYSETKIQELDQSPAGPAPTQQRGGAGFSPQPRSGNAHKTSLLPRVRLARRGTASPEAGPAALRPGPPASTNSRELHSRFCRTFQTFLEAAVTSYHKLAASRQEKRILPQTWRPGVQGRGGDGGCLPRSHRQDRPSRHRPSPPPGVVLKPPRPLLQGPVRPLSLATAPAAHTVLLAGAAGSASLYWGVETPFSQSQETPEWAGWTQARASFSPGILGSP